MPFLSTPTLLLTLTILILLAQPTHAFGAGNIASVARVEGLNWRHGDIEDTLLTLFMSRAAGGKKFDKMNVARVYFGNWLRDYSQAIDVGTVKYVSAEAIRILLWVLGFMTFGYGTKEFEVTTDRLGCYRPEDHIDNPKDYADNIDATQYDTRLRGLVDERVELGIDERTGLKNYIANEQAGIMTSALHVRRLFGKCIQLGRSYARNQNKADLHEALRLLGTGLHCLEDFSAHSNYTELALIEMGERDVFPHVGRRTEIRLQGARGSVYPLVTGTFGGVDFLHSVMGEFDDKATQSEIQELEGTLQNGSQADTSVLKELLSSVPSGLFGGKDEAGKADELQANATAAQMNQMRVSPREPEEFTRQMQEVAKEIYPIIEWHDEVMQSITETIEKIPLLPDLIEQIENQVNVFVFSLIAPFVVPIINQIKAELNTGSSEIIQSSKEKQHIVFNDDHSSDPTHSMLSKDHFSNVLNEPAGKIASQVLKWVVPQLIQAWDDERVDVDRTLNRIINGVFHHPAQRNLGEDGAMDGRRLMFGVVEGWWRSKSEYEQDELRRQLSREGVENGDNHKPGVHDGGHGCGKPLGMTKISGGGAGAGMAGDLVGGLLGSTSGSGGYGGQGGGNYGGGSNSAVEGFASEAVGGGALGGIVGALAGGVGGSLLSGVLSEGEEPKTHSYGSQGYNQHGGYEQSYTEVGRTNDQYAQAQVTETQYSDGGRRTEYSQYQQSSYGGGGDGYERRTEYTSEGRHGYEQSTESWREHTRRDSDDERRGGYQDSSRQEYGGRQEYGERQEYGGRQEYGERQEYGGREEYGGGDGGRGYGGGGGGGYEERSRRDFGGDEYGGGRREYGEERGGGGGGWGGDSREEEREEREEEREEEYREERREESGGGGWFS